MARGILSHGRSAVSNLRWCRNLQVPAAAGHYKALEVFPAGLLNATGGLTQRQAHPVFGGTAAPSYRSVVLKGIAQFSFQSRVS
jgi:hypothetical protein